MTQSRFLLIGAALCMGVAVGPLCGNVFFGIALGALLSTGIGVGLWHRQERLLGLAEARQLVVFRALAERSLRDGEVTSCQHCKRTIRRQARRCLYCGMHQMEGPLR